MAAPSYDAVVIGAGVIGTATALGLARKGFRVCVVDRESGAGQGTTCYSSGILRSTYTARDSVKFAWEGYQYWMDWQAFLGHDGGDDGLARVRECGGLVPRSSASEAWIDKVSAHFVDLGIPHEHLDAAGFLEKLPVADLACYGPPVRTSDPTFGEPSGEQICGALYHATAGYVSDPALAAQNLRVAAEATGRVDFRFGESVTAIPRSASGERVTGVRVSSGSTIEAPVVVNVGGAQSSKITELAFGGSSAPPAAPAAPAVPAVPEAPENDMTVSTRPLRVEVAYVQAPPGDWDYGEQGCFVSDIDGGVYFRPEVGNKILVGSVEPDCDELEWVEDADSTDPLAGGVNMSLTDNWTNYVWRLALRIPGVEIPSSSNTQGVVALYDVTEDWIPVYDKSSLGGFYMAIGTSGNQFKNAGVVSDLMGSLVEYVENGNDHDGQPLQLPLRYTGHRLDSALFSRLRGTSAETSGSVLG